MFWQPQTTMIELQWGYMVSSEQSPSLHMFALSTKWFEAKTKPRLAFFQLSSGYSFKKASFVECQLIVICCCNYSDHINLHISNLYILLKRLHSNKGWKLDSFFHVYLKNWNNNLSTRKTIPYDETKILGHIGVWVTSAIRNLGITTDSSLCYVLKSCQIMLVWKLCHCFHHLKNIGRLGLIVSQSEIKVLINAFDLFHLDYCNKF